MLQFLYKCHCECGSYRKSPHGYFNLKFCKNQISFAFRAPCVLSPMRILFWRSEQEVPFLYSLYSFSACVPYPAATVTGSQLPAEPSRSASLRGEDGLCLLQAAEVSVNPGGCWVSSQGFPPLTMRRIPAAALSLTLLQDSPHCLRDAARSPRVNVLLPGGDGLPLSPLSTCFSIVFPDVTMLAFYSPTFPTSDCAFTRIIFLNLLLFLQDFQRWTLCIYPLVLQWSEGCKVRQTVAEVISFVAGMMANLSELQVSFQLFPACCVKAAVCMHICVFSWLPSLQARCMCGVCDSKHYLNVFDAWWWICWGTSTELRFIKGTFPKKKKVYQVMPTHCPKC